MRLPFAKYGMKELKLYGGITGAVMVVALVLCVLYVRPLPLAFLLSLLSIAPFVWVLSFFRDPERLIPKGERRIISPADGAVYDIGDFDEPEYIGEECTRIGIFMSVFDCHVNRVPCSGTVEKIVYKQGSFFSAYTRASEASLKNESNFIGIGNAAGTGSKLAFKQIAGQVARRIVCELNEGDEVRRGQRCGMIKFGSRVELFIPKSSNVTLKVKLKDFVKAGKTVIGKLETPSDRKPGPDAPEGDGTTDNPSEDTGEAADREE